MIADLIPANRTELIVRHFEQNGYVGVAGAYSPSIADAATRELEAAADPYEPSVPGERRATINDCMPTNIRPIATEFLMSLDEVARVLGSSLWPALPPTNSIIDIIRMEPGIHGVAHRDIITVIGVVAIGTLAGDSRLLLEDCTEYALGPGDVVFLDATERIWHQGIAGTSRERVGIVVAKEKPLPLHRTSS